MQPANQFYGDRSAEVKNPFGNRWWIDTHIEDLAREEVTKLDQVALGQEQSSPLG
jgi:PhnB protein